MGAENPKRQKHIAEMSADECDSAIRDLRQKQSESMPRTIVTGRSRSVWDWLTDLDDVDISDLPLRRPRSIAEDWEQDAANLRGDMERVGRDMWIGMLSYHKDKKVMANAPKENSDTNQPIVPESQKVAPNSRDLEKNKNGD